MNEAVIHVHRGGPLVALVGNPNCGKTALFNLLTGSRQKVANYAGVTVERKEGKLVTPAGKSLRMLDLPGAYSLHPRSLDERVTCDVLFGQAQGEKRPDLVVCVVDATNLRRNLRLVLSVKRLGLPCVVALNMADLAERRGVVVDADALAARLGVPVVSTVGIQREGAEGLLALPDKPVAWQRSANNLTQPEAAATDATRADHDEVQSILQNLGLDKLMGGVGLSGRSFIPLLSSFACAIPGIMATRTIADPRDRLVTIMIAPLMTCSARLPVYALLIGAFVPASEVWGGFELQGLVLFGLYVAGIVGALAVAWVLKRFTSGGQVRSLMMELPNYHWPTVRNVAIGLWQRVMIFIKRVGGIILVLTIALWFLASYPAPPEGATRPAIEYSLAGTMGRALAVVFEPIGFNWQISIALVPGLAAREVAVSALGTVYALSATDDDAAQALVPLIAQDWSLATALSLLAWYVVAPQCLSTLATVKRETGGWAMPVLMAAYLFALAYAAAFITYRATLWLTA